MAKPSPGPSKERLADRVAELTEGRGVSRCYISASTRTHLKKTKINFYSSFTLFLFIMAIML